MSVHLPNSRCHCRFTKPLFRFEAMWLQSPGCADVVQEAWLKGLYKPNGAEITNCLDSCRAKLSTWNKTDFGHVGRHVDRLTKKLQALERQPINNEDEIHEVRKALNCWLDAENTMWHQRSRSMWITNGDRNTNFLHQKASNRKQRNLIQGLSDSVGNWQEDDNAVEAIILDYFTLIFRSNGTTDMAALLDAIQPVVTEAMNEYPTFEFSPDEVHKALKQMHPKKSYCDECKYGTWDHTS